MRVVGDRSRPQSIRSADIAKHTRESFNRQYGEIKSGVTAVNQMSATALEVAKASKQTVMETAMETVTKTVMETGSMMVNVKEVRRV